MLSLRNSQSCVDCRVLQEAGRKGVDWNAVAQAGEGHVTGCCKSCNKLWYLTKFWDTLNFSWNVFHGVR